MRIKSIRLASVVFLLASACAGFPYFGRKEADAGNVDAAEGEAQGTHSGPSAMLELHDIQYDGGVLSGRLLVGALVDGLRLDKRLISSIHVNVDSVRTCATDQPVPYVLMDGFIPPAQDEDLLILNRGYWFGAKVRFWLFLERGPECINAELSLLSFEGKRVASVRVRAERGETQVLDGGMPGEPLPTDAGI
jgi:hypothetical protein